MKPKILLSTLEISGFDDISRRVEHIRQQDGFIELEGSFRRVLKSHVAVLEQASSNIHSILR